MSPVMRALGLSIALGGCAPAMKADPASVTAAREVSTRVALPGEDALLAASSALVSSTTALSASPTIDGLHAAQASWRETRITLRSLDALGFGPIQDLRTADAIDFAPVNADALQAWVAGTGPIDASAVDDAGANLKGFAALELFLFAGSDAQTLAAFASAPRQGALTLALAEAVQRDVQRLDDAWKGNGGYGAALAAPGSGNTIFPTAKAAIDALVNQSFFVVDLQANGVIGKPFGKKNAGLVDVTLERSHRSANTLREIRASLEGMRAVYETGLGPLVVTRNADTDVHLRGAWDAAFKRLGETEETFSFALTNRPAEVEALYQSLRDLKGAYGSELATSLGITLRFSDSDGD